MASVVFEPPVSGAAIILDNLSKTYRRIGKRGAHQALKGISLTIPVGSIFGLLGPNGAGKSTLINILAGTVLKTGGTAVVWGVDIDDNPRQARSNIGVVPQELNIDSFFTPYETLHAQAGLFGVPIHERCTDEILALIGLSDQAESYARTLSGGMRRRLLVGKAMVHSPPVLILDEPTAGVDVSLRQRLWDMIKALNSDGVTIILTTHYLTEAELLCDHVAILNHGRMVKCAATADLLTDAGYKLLVFEVRGNEGLALSPELKNLGADFVDGRLSVRYDPRAIDAGAIMSKVNDSGYVITDVTTSSPALEDVFVNLTRD